MPMPSMLISSVAAGMAADIVAVPMSIDIVLDIPDMSMVVAVAISELAGSTAVCNSARIRFRALLKGVGKVATVC